MTNRVNGGPGTNQYRSRGSAKLTSVPSTNLVQQASAGTNDTSNGDDSNTAAAKPAKETIDAIGWRLAYKDGTSDKVYTVVVCADLLLFMWGRRGAVGQAQLVVPKYPGEIPELARAQTQSKRSKGYRPEREPLTFPMSKQVATQLWIETKRNSGKVALDRTWLEEIQQDFETAAADPRTRSLESQSSRGSYSYNGQYFAAAIKGQQQELEVPAAILAMWRLSQA